MNAKTRAILSTLFTIVLAIIGFSQYSSGYGYMTFFGIELSRGVFFVLIGAFIVFDIIAFVNASKTEEQIEEQVSQDEETFSTAEELSDPCSVSLTRNKNLMGAAIKSTVYLNGNQLGQLKNGQTLEFETKSKNNKLMIVNNKDNMSRAIEFEAEPGGEVNINFNYVKGELSIV